METLMKRALDIAHLFDVPRGEMACEPYGTGNINDTFCLTMAQGGRRVRYILQRINSRLFPDVAKLMHNIALVTAFCRRSVLARGGDPMRECLTIVPTRAGEN